MHKYQNKPTIHLHIGTHKTGTTSLQKFLDSNQKILKKFGILYPKTGWYHYSQHLLAFQLKGTTPNGVDTISDDIWMDLNKEISKSKLKNIVISSEIFATLNKEQIDQLKKELSDYNVKIYLYLRRQDELFESIYNQQVKEWRNPRKETISYFMNKKNKLYGQFNYFQLVYNWSMVFGKENISIRAYHKEYVTDTVSDFINLLDLDDSMKKAFKSIKNENYSVSAKALEMIRLAKFVETDIIIREKIFYLANQMFPATKTNKTYLNKGQKTKITEQFMQSNKKLIDQYFDEGQEYLLYPPLDFNEKEILSKVDLLSIIISLIKKG